MVPETSVDVSRFRKELPSDANCLLSSENIMDKFPFFNTIFPNGWHQGCESGGIKVHIIDTDQGIDQGMVEDPGGVTLDPDPTLKKPETKTGSGSACFSSWSISYFYILVCLIICLSEYQNTLYLYDCIFVCLSLSFSAMTSIFLTICFCFYHESYY